MLTSDQRTALGNLYLAVVDYGDGVPGARERFQFWQSEAERLECPPWYDKVGRRVKAKFPGIGKD